MSENIPFSAAVRLDIERREELALAPGAIMSRSAVRQRPEEESPVRAAFQRDCDRILYSKSFRRLMHKTQVFIAPENDHFTTRLSHTHEVSRIARAIGRALCLNEDLIEAIALAHDLGHAPFGHAGEQALSEVFSGFLHSEQSLRVVDVIENSGRGLNLTDHVREGIQLHSKPDSDMRGGIVGHPATLEAEVVRLADTFAYITHDLVDAMTAQYVSEADLQGKDWGSLGSTTGQRVDALVYDVIENSTACQVPGLIAMSAPVERLARDLRGFLFERLYLPLRAHPDTVRSRELVRRLFEYFVQNPALLSDKLNSAGPEDSAERAAVDFVAGMTDHFAMELAALLFGEEAVPQAWRVPSRVFGSRLRVPLEIEISPATSATTSKPQ